MDICCGVGEQPSFPPAHIQVKLEKDQGTFGEYGHFNYLVGFHFLSLLLDFQSQLTEEDAKAASKQPHRYVGRLLCVARAQGVERAAQKITVYESLKSNGSLHAILQNHMSVPDACSAF